MRQLFASWRLVLASSVALFGASGGFGATVDLQGLNKGSTNYFGGPLNGWQELDFIPCRVVVNNAGSNQVVVYFNNNANNKPGLQNLFYFTPSTNAAISTPILTASSALQDWYYTFNVFVTNPPAYVYYQARMAAGAHLFGGASLHMYNPQLQLAKPVPASGTPDLVILKTGPAIVQAGQVLTYSVTFSNKLTAANTSIGNEIYDTLPNGLTYVNIWSGTPGVQFFQQLGNELWWDLPDLQPGDWGTLTYQVMVASNIANGTVLQNDAQILSTQNDANMADNISVVTTTVTNVVPPTAQPDGYSVSRNQTLSIGAPGVLANDTDPLNGSLKAYLSTNATSGSLTLNTDGSFNFVPAANFSGTVYFYYAASNATALSQPAKVTINVPYFVAPADANLSCASLLPAAATNLTQFLAQGGVDGGPYCGQPTTISSVTDFSNGGAGCAASPLVITRTYQLTTGCGDVTNLVQKFTIVDSTAPVISAFPLDATYSCAGQVPAPNDSLVTASDNCSGVTITHNADVVTSSNCVNRLTISRTYVATDACGNSSSRTQTLTVNGTTAPTITTFPADLTYSCAAAVPAANDTLVAALNACGGSAGVVITHNADVISSSNCVNRFTVSRTYIATDACGNSASKTQTITVNGTTPPAITAFPTDATYSCASAVPAADNSSVIAVDNCGGSAPVTITHDADVVGSSNCVSRFTITRTYRATDACGNVTTRSQIITVNATTPPSITGFPADATVECASAVPMADNTLVTAADGCGGAGSIVVTHAADVVTSSNCVNRFTVTRTYVATDACGNSASKSQTITVNDTNAPTITGFPVDATYSCAGSVPAPDDSLVTAADGCGGSSVVTISHDADVVTSSNCVNRFTITRTYRATDACGNVATQSQTITVNATTVPVITTFPSDATYSCASAVPAADDSLVAATDNCSGNSTVTITHNADVVTPGACANRFTIARTYVATDSCGNSSSRTQTITVDQVTPPTFATFPADSSYSCLSAVPAADDSTASATDGCGGSGVAISHLADVVGSSNCVSRMTITRTYIATDSCGNSASKAQVITINGTIPPNITTFPADATFSCLSAVPAADDTLVKATDNCGTPAAVSINHDPDVVTSSNCANRLVITRTYRATDACGNVATKSQTLTVNSTTAPTITGFPVDATYSCGGDVPAPNDSLITATDGCGGSVGLVVTHDPDVVVSKVCTNRYTLSRTYHVTDVCGNATSKSQSITVASTAAPTIVSFPPDATYQCPAAVPAPNDLVITAIDQCGGKSDIVITHDQDVISSSNCLNRFVITRTYRASDACGNIVTQDQKITVDSTVAPTITTFPPDATYSCAGSVPAANDGLLSATNACGGSTGVVISHVADAISASNCVNRFSITRTYIATDDCGNSTSRSQTITVNGTTPPTITGFPADATYACASGVPGANDSLVSATNACGGNSGLVITHFADLISSSNCVNRFTITRTYIATDACGNSASKNQMIVVNGTVPPTITAFPADATYGCAGSVPAANNSLVSAANACGGNSGLVITHSADVISTSNCVNHFTISRVYTATDACGNSSTRTQTITVNGTTPPTITTFPADASYSCQLLVPPPNDSLVAAQDNCGSAAVVITHDPDVVTSSNCVSHFTITRTYRATDACGNMTAKNQTIVVNDTIPPVVSCPSSVTVSLPANIPVPNPNTVTASDNCSSAHTSFVNDAYSTNGYTVTITRTYAATDDCGNSATCSQTITFNPQLAQPVANADSYSVLENQTLNIGMPGVLGNDTDPNSLPLQAVLVSSTTNGVLTLNSNGSFQYTPTTYYFGSDAFSYKASNGGTNPSAPVVVTINVGFVNQQPTFTKGPDVSVLEDSNLTSTNWATNIKAGPANESNQYVNFTVSNDNPALFSVQPSIATNGTLTLAPAPLTIGSANVTVLLHDDGGTVNGGVDTSAAQTFVITVVPVNHAPSFTKGPNKVVNNYAGAQTVTNWASNISPGPAHESNQTLNFIVSNDNNSIFSSQPSIDANGTLMFAPATNKFGDAKVSVALHDNGGTANGGHDTSATQTFVLTVNNPPIVSITSPTNTSLFLYPSPVTIIADAYDLDGIVTNVIFLNGTNVIGVGTLDSDDFFTFSWTNAPATNCVLYALAADNYGATNISAPVNIELGNPVAVSGGPIVFSPSLYSWGQKLSVTNPTISTVESVTVTFTSVSAGTSIQSVTGTNALGQPYIVFNNVVGPASYVANYATILYLANSQPVVTFSTSASLTAGPSFTVNSTNLVKVTRRQFQNDGSFLLNFMSTTNKTYYVQYSCDMKTWLTSPLPLKGNGTQLQWVDFGPGMTECAPRSTQYRFYRVVAP